MIKIKFIGMLFAFSLFVINDVQAKTFNIEEFYLDNGLQVVVIENHKAPIVKQMLFYKAGAVDEMPGKGGIAHLLEHLMFRGTNKIKGQNFNKLMEENGAESNAFTSRDVTAYHQFVDVSRLELAMFLEADRMKNLDISEDDFETEKNIVFQERKQRIDNNPQAVFMEKLNKVLWQDHPYGKPVTGSDEEILTLKREDAKEFYKKYYAPNNAILVLAGDVDKDMAKKLAEKYYGDIRSNSFNKTMFKEEGRNYRTKMEMSLPDIEQDRFVRLFVAPSFVQNAKMAYALEILVEYLNDGVNSPLYQKMVLKDKSALGISLSYNGVSRSYGDFALSVVPVGRLDDVFEKKLDKAWKYSVNRLNENELEKVKQKMLVDLVYLQDNPSSMAALVGSLAASGLDVKTLNNYAQSIKEVSLNDVREAADYLWRKAHQATGMLYSEGNNNE